mmetsp:Transcript_34098/g.98142  ORF Transcript_34098/g.98142 Transcript_34098/m.98142 type:complete len:276 (+) Transcript_34098:804-1631(+)
MARVTSSQAILSFGLRVPSLSSTIFRHWLSESRRSTAACITASKELKRPSARQHSATVRERTTLAASVHLYGRERRANQPAASCPSIPSICAAPEATCPQTPAAPLSSSCAALEAAYPQKWFALSSSSSTSCWTGLDSMDRSSPAAPSSGERPPPLEMGRCWLYHRKMMISSLAARASAPGSQRLRTCEGATTGGEKPLTSPRRSMYLQTVLVVACTVRARDWRQSLSFCQQVSPTSGMLRCSILARVPKTSRCLRCQKSSEARASSSFGEATSS